MNYTFLQKPAISTAQHLVNLTAIHSSLCVAVDVNVFQRTKDFPIGQFFYLCTIIYISNPQFSLVYNNSSLIFQNWSFVCRIFV